jgi:hypothetical protein
VNDGWLCFNRKIAALNKAGNFERADGVEMSITCISLIGDMVLKFLFIFLCLVKGPSLLI